MHTKKLGGQVPLPKVFWSLSSYSPRGESPVCYSHCTPTTSWQEKTVQMPKNNLAQNSRQRYPAPELQSLHFWEKG